MDLKTYFSTLDAEAREGFAKSCETTVGHIRNVIGGSRTASPALCVAIERESQGQVTRRDLKPTDWHRLWPELSTAEQGA